MKILKMNSISTIIKKFLCLLIGGVSVTVLTLSISFAYTVPPTITTPLSEPEVSASVENGKNRYKFYQVFYYVDQFAFRNYNYLICVFDCLVPTSITCGVFYNGYDGGFFTSQNNSNTVVSCSVYDGVSGSLIAQKDICGVKGVYQGYMYNIGAPAYFPNSTFDHSTDPNPTFDNPSFFKIPDGMVVKRYDQNVEPYIIFSQRPPEHNIYHSHLSEPVADKYNRYFLLDDKLYWISLRVNGAYVLVNDVLTESEVESYTTTGEYMGAVQSGTGNSSLITLGNQTTYKDLEVYPVKFKSEQYFDNDLIYLSIYYTNNGTDLRLNLDKLALVKALSVDRLYIETELYYSVFNLESGDYVESFYQDYDGYVSSNVSLNANLPDEISDIKCYGISFLNVDNRPVNLSDVYWQYDMEFVEWRDRMERMIEKIYQALSGETVETETYTQPSWNEDLSQAEPTTRISQQEIQSVFDAGFDDVKPSPDDQLYITSWVDMFSVPKLIAACCFALAMGTIILTLGKKKSD